MSKHTPTPWRLSGQMIVGENSYRVAEVNSPDYRARGKERREDWEYCRGNAEFIVRACNNHDALVEKLKAQFHAVDWLMAKLIAADPTFMPSESPIWDSVKGTHAALTAAGAI
ncbi:hypothetical protein [Herbaspirillum sp. RV1423]|uniref:hypothetical protein n=1 Tax=Herbaspirillum sp. RV1423 TaxID=1443993 RepID=UPI0012DC8860|nr:hypothetical protein [Herbaspirillum sp. RV1423]